MANYMSNDNATAVFTGYANAIKSRTGIYKSGTISAGATSITLSDASITTSSNIEIFWKDAVMAPKTVTVATGSVTITIDALDHNQDVKIRITHA